MSSEIATEMTSYIMLKDRIVYLNDDAILVKEYLVQILVIQNTASLYKNT